MLKLLFLKQFPVSFSHGFPFLPLDKKFNTPFLIIFFLLLNLKPTCVKKNNIDTYKKGNLREKELEVFNIDIEIR
jgi:hypothetical protein